MAPSSPGARPDAVRPCDLPEVSGRADTEFRPALQWAGPCAPVPRRVPVFLAAAPARGAGGAPRGAWWTRTSASGQRRRGRRPRRRRALRVDVRARRKAGERPELSVHSGATGARSSRHRYSAARSTTALPPGVQAVGRGRRRGLLTACTISPSGTPPRGTARGRRTRTQRIGLLRPHGAAPLLRRPGLLRRLRLQPDVHRRPGRRRTARP
jgi:hypothetical protein